MTPDDLARLHGLCFTAPRPWTAPEFRDLRNDPKTLLHGDARGFIMGRVIADDAELLTLAIHPDHRRAGLGMWLVDHLIASASARNAAVIFLEVAETNSAARALYAACGFTQTGRRVGYFRDATGVRTDALILSRPL